MPGAIGSFDISTLKTTHGCRLACRLLLGLRRFSGGGRSRHASQGRSQRPLVRRSSHLNNGGGLFLRSMSSEFFTNRTRTVTIEKNRPRKNHSHALRPVFWAQSAQTAPNRNKTKPASPTCCTFPSNAETRLSRRVTRCDSVWAATVALNTSVNIANKNSSFMFFGAERYKPAMRRAGATCAQARGATDS